MESSSNKTKIWKIREDCLVEREKEHFTIFDKISSNWNCVEIKFTNRFFFEFKKVYMFLNQVNLGPWSDELLLDLGFNFTVFEKISSNCNCQLCVRNQKNLEMESFQLKKLWYVQVSVLSSHFTSLTVLLLLQL